MVITIPQSKTDPTWKRRPISGFSSTYGKGQLVVLPHLEPPRALSGGLASGLPGRGGVGAGETI